MIDVSYRYKLGTWLMDEETGEVKMVTPEAPPVIDTVIEGAVEEHLTKSQEKRIKAQK